MRLAVTFPKPPKITVTEAEILADLMYPEPAPRPADQSAAEARR